MRRSWAVLLAGALVAVLALIAIVRRRTAEPPLETTSEDASKQRIREFWESYNKATALRFHGDFDRAAELYRQCLRLNSSHEDSLYYLGTSLEEQGDYNGATATLRQLISLNPSSGRGFSELGNILSALAPGAPANFEEARQAYTRAIQLNPEQASPFLRLGTLEMNQGRYGPALEDFKVAAGFGAAEGYYGAAYVHFLDGRYRESLASLRHVLDAYAKDRKITGRGVLSEGDLLPAPGKPLTALERAGLASMLLLRWVSRRLGGFPAAFPQEFQLHNRAEAARAASRQFTRAPSSLVSGKAAADFDHGGYPGVIVTGRHSGVRLYRNQRGRFEDVTKIAGLSRAKEAWDAYWVDYDRDGYPDLYLVRPGFMGTSQNSLYHNDRNGAFSEVTARMGLAGQRSTARACFADFDGDGRVDLVEVGGADAAHSSVRLFRNTGERFVEVTSPAGLARSATAVDCAVSDYNADGRPDLFVLFWRQEAVLFANSGNGNFRDVTSQAGLKGIRGEGMSAIFFDFDNDRRPDLLITEHAPFDRVVRCLVDPDYRASDRTPRLFRNRGGGSFEEITGRAGLSRSYGTIEAVAADLDRDGWMDLVLVNGGLDAARLEPSVVLHNLQGRRFEEWFYLPEFDAPGNFIGAVVADFNRDGNPDILLSAAAPSKTGAPGGLFLNTIPRPVN